MKEIEHCYNDNKHDECPFLNSATYFDDKIRHKVNENNPSQLLGYQSIIFEVDMLDFQSKIMTYRASIRPNQVCYMLLYNSNMFYKIRSNLPTCFCLNKKN